LLVVESTEHRHQLQLVAVHKLAKLAAAVYLRGFDSMRFRGRRPIEMGVHHTVSQLLDGWVDNEVATKCAEQS
jgi:hypothetical protein